MDERHYKDFGTPLTFTAGCAASKHSTDELIQCTAAKWGIPVDWMRAQFVVESDWSQAAKGDKEYVGKTKAMLYPAQSREKNRSGALTGYVWESLGITQLRWRPDGSEAAGTEPLRWKSTAFNLDYYGATVRFYYDDPKRLRTEWDDPSYVAGEDWWSIGGWYEPYPWHNSGQASYIIEVKDSLARRAWGTLAPGRVVASR